MKNLIIAALSLACLSSYADAGGVAFRARFAAPGCASGACVASVQQTFAQPVFQQTYAAPVQVQRFQTFAAPVQQFAAPCYEQQSFQTFSAPVQQFQSFQSYGFQQSFAPAFVPSYGYGGVGFNRFAVGGFRSRQFFGSPAFFGGLSVRTPGFRLRIR